MENYSLSDIASIVKDNDGFGNMGFFWIFALLLLANGGIGGFNRGDWGQYTSAQTQEILFGQQFQNIDNKIDRLGNGLSDLGFALNNSIKDGNAAVASTVVNEGRNIQDKLCAINSNINDKFAALEKSALEQRIAEQAQQINQLSMAQMLCGIPKVTPSWGAYPGYPYQNQGCGCTGLTTI